MAISFGRAALAFTGGVARGLGEVEDEARRQKKLDERAYLDRYTQAAQNALRFAETDRKERNDKVEAHKQNLGILTSAIKQTGVTDDEARQAAVQIYNKNKTTAAANMASKTILTSLDKIGDDPDERRAIFDDLNATIDPNSTFSIEQFAQQFSGPRTTMKSYMPDMGTFDSRTKLQKLFGREPKESEAITQTRAMFGSMGRKEEPLTSVTIPESDIKLPTPLETGSAQEMADLSYRRYENARDKNPEVAAKHLSRYDEYMRRVQQESILKRAEKDPKAFMSIDQYIKVFTESGTKPVYLSADKERSKIVREQDREYMGTREGVYRSYKYLSSLPAEEQKRIALTKQNFNAVTKQFGFDDAMEQMKRYDKIRLGASSLDVFVTKMETASVLFKTDPQGEFLKLDRDTREAVKTIYGKGVSDSTRNAYFDGLREAFFFPPTIGGSKDSLYSNDIRNLFPI